MNQLTEKLMSHLTEKLVHVKNGVNINMRCSKKLYLQSINWCFWIFSPLTVGILLIAISTTHTFVERIQAIGVIGAYDLTAIISVSYILSQNKTILTQQYLTEKSETIQKEIKTHKLEIHDFDKTELLTHWFNYYIGDENEHELDLHFIDVTNNVTVKLKGQPSENAIIEINGLVYKPQPKDKIRSDITILTSGLLTITYLSTTHD